MPLIFEVKDILNLLLPPANEIEHVSKLVKANFSIPVRVKVVHQVHYIVLGRWRHIHVLEEHRAHHRKFVHLQIARSVAVVHLEDLPGVLIDVLEIEGIGVHLIP